MALSIYNNLYSVVAQGKLDIANRAISKSIERLSSGLRINSAADDASGLAISEKLRGQIRGLAKASMNAQDAVSFLQTAEGGMEVIGSMLQRMRELAVQAGNGTYTSNDRKELQKEVDQLKEEVNRIATSTEYNTKKLLTGQSAALWSTSDPSAIEAIVRGAPAQGNYDIEVTATGGQNWVYKSDIMNESNPDKSVNTFDYEAKYTGNAAKNSFQNIEGEITKAFNINIADSGAATTVAAGGRTIAVHNGTLSTGESSTLRGTLTQADTLDDAGVNKYLVIEALKDGDITDTTLADGAFKMYSVDARTGAKTELAVTAVNGTPKMIEAGNVQVTLDSGTTVFAKGDKIIIAVDEAITPTNDEVAYSVGDGPAMVGNIAQGATGMLEYSTVEMDDTGNISIGRGQVEFANGAAGGETAIVAVSPKQTEKSNMEVNAGNTVGTTVDKGKSNVVGGMYPNGLDVTIKKDNTTGVAAGAWVTGRAIDDVSLNMRLSGVAGTETASYLIEFLNDFETDDTNANGTSNVKVTVTNADTGLEKEITGTWAATANTGGTLTFDTGLVLTFEMGDIKAGDKVLVQNQEAIPGAVGTDTATAGNFSKVIPAGETDNVSMFNVQLDDAGNVYKSRINLSLADNTSGKINFSTPQAKTASLETKLKDIPLFTNADGRMVLDNTQTLTIYGNGQQTDIYMEGEDSVEDFRKKLNDALLKLGMGTGNSDIDNNLVDFVTEEEAQESGNKAVAGTFIIQGGIVGDNSKISIIGDEGVLNALSIMDIQTGENSDLNVKVSDAHTGRLIGQDTVSDNILRGIIDGIDVKISNPKLNNSYNSTTGKITFTAPETPLEYQLHVVDKRTEVQIGANEGQTFDISIGQMDTTALEIDDAFVMTMADSQKAITKFDQALEKVNGARATIGAQINRLDYTMQNLSTTRQNLIASESRIRDLDVAEESAAFSKNQILVNSAIAMLAQANQLPQVALQLIGR